jgi:SAM-dependent methyltransferase
MRFADYVEANREAWDEAASKHRAHARFAELLAGFERPGYSCLDPIETEILQSLGVAGKSVAQLCCNNGRELLSVLSLGALRGTGFDISEAFLRQANELRAASGRDCEFVQGSVFEISPAYDSVFDLVIFTIGTLGWMPDLKLFFGVVRRLLRQGGHVFIYEQHPICDMFDPGDPEPLKIRHSYFKAEPFKDETGLDYLSNVHYTAKPAYWFHHKMSDVIGGCLDNGLALERFEEYAHDIGAAWGPLAASPTPPPLCYTLVARRA